MADRKEKALSELQVVIAVSRKAILAKPSKETEFRTETCRDEVRAEENHDSMNFNCHS